MTTSFFWFDKDRASGAFPTLDEGYPWSLSGYQINTCSIGAHFLLIVEKNGRGKREER